MSFTLAMKAELTRDPGPNGAIAKVRCLVVTRIESAANFLTMADIGPFRQPVPFRPDFNGIMIGALAHADDAGNENFSLCTAPPAGLSLSTSFIPASGKVVLGQAGKLPILWGKISGWQPCEAPFEPASTCHWRIKAEYVPWDGELRAPGLGCA